MCHGNTIFGVEVDVTLLGLRLDLVWPRRLLDSFGQLEFGVWTSSGKPTSTWQLPALNVIIGVIGMVVVLSQKLKICPIKCWNNKAGR